ncbi:hypothetical protein P7C70_g7821, partial [Phenoliferia sp. Uapishka_3]
MRHPQIVDVCDFGARLFGGSPLAYWWTGFMLLANNVLVIGFHVFTGARIIQTLDDGRRCTVIWSAVFTVLGIIASLPRSLNHITAISVVSAGFMGLSILLFLIFSGIEDHPLKGYSGAWPEAGAKVYTTAFPAEGVTWVDCLNAVLNITFLWTPQILYPTFIAEMERPQDFPKALAGLSAASFILFIMVPIVGYHYLGQYAEAPSFGSLQTKYAKAGFAFAIIPTIVIGVIYCNVTSKFIYGRLMRSSRHAHSHTFIGWGIWVAVVAGVWIVAFVMGSVISSMGDFLSLLGAAFDEALLDPKTWLAPLRNVATPINGAFPPSCGFYPLLPDSGIGIYSLRLH